MPGHGNFSAKTEKVPNELEAAGPPGSSGGGSQSRSSPFCAEVWATLHGTVWLPPQVRLAEQNELPLIEVLPQYLFHMCQGWLKGPSGAK